MGYVQERYKPITVPVNSSVLFPGSGTGGFLAVTSGTVTVVRPDGLVLLPPIAVTAGTYLPIPMYVSHTGGTATTAGGASGVLLQD